LRLAYVLSEIYRQIFRGEQRGIQTEHFFRGQEAFGLDDGDNGLIERRETPIPKAFFVTEGKRKRLKASHGGHFLDAIDEESRSGATQNENERGRRGRQTEMHRAVYDVERLFGAVNDMLHFAKVGLSDFASGSREAVHAANFLNARGGNGEELSADAKENDLLGTRRGSFCGRWEAHYFAPTGAVRQMPMTRFSMAA
jgi:hypothetical protein